MYIHEAVNQAMKEGKYIDREKFQNETAYYKLKVKPTNSSAMCMAYTFDQNGKEVHHCKNWNPTAEDLTADDWRLSD